ncbi:hypothetical protein FSP39_022460 [Pinctada imbricata]|uniref:Integrase catalytic domain-containing protein n=1 Tax=Pinctada imbricata TaxID=66713 RepID=A0AA89BWD8_PINIB|nr:hypothetical protein FSP39_022460 [Pinctada imbricata]
MSDKALKRYLENIYNDPSHPGGYAGVEKLYQVVKNEGKFKVGRERIRNFLQSQESYSLQRTVRRKFPRNRVIVGGIDRQWDIDLASVENLEKHNPKVKFLLICIDIFSRFLWVQPLENKLSSTIIEGLNVIFSKGRKPQCIRHDGGTEFTNKKFDDFLKSEHVKHFTTYNTETKANYAERVIRTIKESMYRYFSAHRTYSYISILPKLVSAYNRRPHKGLFNLRPIDVQKRIENDLWKKMYLGNKKNETKSKNTKLRTKRFKFKVGDLVRISHLKHTFIRAYHQKWSEELFKIYKRIMRDGIPIYRLIDLSDDEIKGSFYQSELQRVILDKDKQLWKIDKVVKKRKRLGKTECLVRWQGYPSKFDSWIPEENIHNL